MVQSEIWVDIIDFEGYYQISNYGRVKSLRRVIHRNKMGILILPERILNPHIDVTGYKRLYLYKKDFKTREFVHRIVALHFIENHNNKPQINHKNGIKTDNNIENLEWCTGKENVHHAFRIGLNKASIGEQKGTSKLKEIEVVIIKKLLKGNQHTQQEIANMYNVSRCAIKEIKFNRNWKHV